jgi:hypothetical protein
LTSVDRIPSESGSSEFFMSSKIDFSMQFYENQAGRVFDIETVSRNRESIADIPYKLLLVSHGDKKWLSHFELKSDWSTVNWYLNCSTPFNLIDRDQLEVAFLVRARESDSLHTDYRVLLRVINGDMCKLTFDGEIYKFTVSYHHASLGIEMKNAFDYEKLVANQNG